MTRPRRPSGTVSWIIVLAVTAIAMPPAPAIAIARSDTGNDVDHPSISDPIPRAIPPAGIHHAFGRRVKATHSEATVEPTPDAAIRNPKPSEPTLRIWSARGGTRTWKFMPNVATRPTTVVASSATGVTRT